MRNRLIAIGIAVVTALGYVGLLGTVGAKDQVVNAFAGSSLTQINSKVECVLDTTNQDLIVQCARDLGFPNYVINMDNGILRLKGYSDNATMLITSYFEKKGSTYVEIDIDNEIGKAFDYREQLEAWNKRNGFDCISYLYASGSLKGEMSLEMQNTLARHLLDDMNVKTVEEHKGKDCFCIYGYNKELGNGVLIRGQAVNCNLTMNYDEIKDLTKVYVALPMNNEDF